MTNSQVLEQGLFFNLGVGFGKDPVQGPWKKTESFSWSVNFLHQDKLCWKLDLYPMLFA